MTGLVLHLFRLKVRLRNVWKTFSISLRLLEDRDSFKQAYSILILYYLFTINYPQWLSMYMPHVFCNGLEGIACGDWDYN